MRLPELEALKRLLWEEWDPIGVNATDCPEDEYDSYAMQVFSKLKEGAAAPEIENYLDWIETERMGLTGIGGRNAETARRSVALHQFYL